MTISVRVPRRAPLPPLPEPRSLDNMCLCPGCYFIATEHSELCLRCSLDGCDHEENRHG